MNKTVSDERIAALSRAMKLGYLTLNDLEHTDSYILKEARGSKPKI